jgi:hypothetical protein
MTNIVDTLIDKFSASRFVLNEESFESMFASALHLFKAGPGGEEIAEHKGVLFGKPLQYVGIVAFEQASQSVGQAGSIIDKTTAILD